MRSLCQSMHVASPPTHAPPCKLNITGKPLRSVCFGKYKNTSTSFPLCRINSRFPSQGGATRALFLLRDSILRKKKICKRFADIFKHLRFILTKYSPHYEGGFLLFCRSSTNILYLTQFTVKRRNFLATDSQHHHKIAEFEK